MRGQQFAGLSDRFHDGVAEFLVLKMGAHLIDNSLPECFTAFFVNHLVAYHSKLMCTRRHENEHGVALARLVHTQPVKFFLRCNKRIDI